MKKKLAVICASLVCMVGGLAAIPSSADAFVFAGSCGWSLDGIPWHYSPAYGVYYYYTGHELVSGHYYRTFRTYSPIRGYYDQWLVYCG